MAMGGQGYIDMIYRQERRRGSPSRSIFSMQCGAIRGVVPSAKTSGGGCKENMAHQVDLISTMKGGEVRDVVFSAKTSGSRCEDK